MRWEYRSKVWILYGDQRFHDLMADREAALNAWGAEGWELATSVPLTTEAGSTGIADTLRRPSPVAD